MNYLENNILIAPHNNIIGLTTKAETMPEIANRIPVITRIQKAQVINLIPTCKSNGIMISPIPNNESRIKQIAPTYLANLTTKNDIKRQTNKNIR